MTVYSLIGAILFLAVGVLVLAFFNRSLYPGLRWRHEKAKITQEQGVSPRTIMLIVKIQSLIVMPILGFLLGDRMKSILG